MKKSLSIIIVVVAVLSLILSFGFPWKTGKNIITEERLMEIFPITKDGRVLRYTPLLTQVSLIEPDTITVIGGADPIPLVGNLVIIQSDNRVVYTDTSAIYVGSDSIYVKITANIYYCTDAAGVIFQFCYLINGNMIPGRDALRGVKIIGDDENTIAIMTSIKLGKGDELKMCISATETADFISHRMDWIAEEIKSWR